MSRKIRGSKVLITGGTGSFGSNMARHLLTRDVEEIRIFSRDEAKQVRDRFARKLGLKVVFVDASERFLRIKPWTQNSTPKSRTICRWW